MSPDRIREPEDLLFHICTRGAADAATACGVYDAPSLQSEGFIHLSFRDQVAGVHTRYYAQTPDLVVLVIARNRLTAPLKIELPVRPGGEVYASDDTYPHLYGRLNIEAVVDCVPVREGAFSQGYFADTAP